MDERAKAPVVVVRGPSAFSRILDAIKPSNITEKQKTASPEELKRVDAQVQRFMQREQEHAAQRTQEAGRKAVSALDALHTKPASPVMREMEEAASKNPEGMKGVVREMRPGGQHAALHAKFEAAKRDNPAFAEQITAAREAVASYGVHRGKLDQSASERGNTHEVNASFEALDGEVGSKAGKVPGKEGGTSLVDDLSDKVKEVVKKAVSVISNIVRPSASASASPAP